MPIRRVSPYEKNIFEQPLTKTKTKERHYGLMAGAATVLGGMAVGFAVSMGGAGEAHADVISDAHANGQGVNVLVLGGRGSGRSSHELQQILINTRQVDESKDNLIPVEYPEQIAPLDEITMRASVDLLDKNGQEAIDTQLDPNKKTVIISYSQGTAGGFELTNANPGKVDELVSKEGPYGPGGISHNAMANDQRVTSFADQFGIILHEPMPTSKPVVIDRNNGDTWSTGENMDEGQVLATIGPTFFGNAHAPSNENEAHYTERQGNVTVNSFGYDETPDSVMGAPVVYVPAQAPAAAPDVAPVVDAAVTAPEAQPDAAPVVDTPAPEVPAPAAPEAAPVVDESVPAPEAPASDAPAPDLTQADMALAG